jgi:NADPH:quinone reductase-like Zn-dependent oxidoreductase
VQTLQSWLRSEPTLSSRPITPIEFPARDLMMPLAQVSGFYLGNWMAQQSPIKLLGLLRAVRRLTAEGVFQADVSETYPLEQVSTAVATSLKPGRTGKVMLRIGSSWRPRGNLGARLAKLDTTSPSC